MSILSGVADAHLSVLVWLALLHSVWIGLIAGSVARLAAAIVATTSHRTRRGLALAGLAAVAIGSPTATLLQARGQRPDMPITPISLVVPRAGVASPPSMPAPTPVLAVATPPLASVSARSAWGRDAVVVAASAVRTTRPYATALWAAGALSFILVLTAGSCRLRKLRREARPVEDLRSHVHSLATRLRMRRPPAAYVHPGVPEPCLVGVLRPMILLPKAWLAGAGAGEIDAVIAHELAHARRLDHVANLAQRFVEAGFFFHPCVHWLSRSARREAEHAADALAVRATGDPLALARALERAARFRSSPSRSPAFGVAVGGDRPALLSRIQELLGMKPPRPRLALWPFGALPAAVVGGVLAASVDPAQQVMTPAERYLSRAVEEGRLPFEAHPKVRASGLNQAWTTIPDLHRAPMPPETAWMINADPATLTDEELAILVRHLRPSVDDPSLLRREELLRLAEVEQIRFEVRYLEVFDEDWLRLSWDRVASVAEGEAGAGRSAWLADTSGMVGLLREGCETQGFRVLTGLMTSSPEEYHIIMSIGSNGAAVDSMLKAMNSATTPDPTARLLGPVDAAALGREGKLTFVEALKASHCLDLAAAATPEGFAVSVRTAGLPDAERVRQQGGAEPQAPVVRRIDVQVPEHATLIIDPGFDLAVLAPGASDRKRLRTFLAITPRLGRELVEPAPRVYSRRPEPVPVP